MARQCVICGARVRNENQKVVTCDPTCTAALKNNRTRNEQFAYELAHPSERDDWYAKCPGGCGQFLSQCQCYGET